jgi:hypothetical protein
MATHEEDALENNQNEELKQVQPMKFYLTNISATFKIVHTRWGQFCIIVGILYIYHLIWCMVSVNAFAS